jgi:hypothetical protein
MTSLLSQTQHIQEGALSMSSLETATRSQIEAQLHSAPYQELKTSLSICAIPAAPLLLFLSLPKSRWGREWYWRTGQPLRLPATSRQPMCLPSNSSCLPTILCIARSMLPIPTQTATLTMGCHASVCLLMFHGRRVSAWFAAPCRQEVP